MSLFVAVFPPEPVRADLARRVAGLRVAAATAASTAAITSGGRGHARRTPPAKWHLTLAFLGDVPDDRVTGVEEAVSGAVRTPRAPVLRLAGGGFFGRGRSSVLWVGVDGDVAGLSGLHADLQQALGAAGLPVDDRPFTPHLTVAYPGERFDPSDLRADRDELAAYAGPPWTVDGVVLVRSRAGTYEPVRTWRWGGPLGADR